MSFWCVQLWLKLEGVSPVGIRFWSLHSSQVCLSKAQYAYGLEILSINICNYSVHLKAHIYTKIEKLYSLDMRGVWSCKYLFFFLLCNILK